MSVVQQTGANVVHLARLRDKLFAPVVEDNKNTGDIVETLAGIVSESFLQELHDTILTKHRTNILPPQDHCSLLHIVQKKFEKT